MRQGLNQTGYVEGKNLKIESRFGEGKYNRLPALAAELVRRQVEVSPAGMLEKGEVQVAGSTLGVDEFLPLEIKRTDDIAPAFAAFKGRADALYVVADPLANLLGLGRTVASGTLRHPIPAPELLAEGFCLG